MRDDQMIKKWTCKIARAVAMLTLQALSDQAYDHPISNDSNFDVRGLVEKEIVTESFGATDDLLFSSLAQEQTSTYC